MVPVHRKLHRPDSPCTWRIATNEYTAVTSMEYISSYRLLIPFHNRGFLELAGPTMSWCLSHKAVACCNHRHWKTVRTCVFLIVLSLQVDLPPDPKILTRFGSSSFQYPHTVTLEGISYHSLLTRRHTLSNYCRP